MKKILYISLITIFSSCGFYSFTGASISPDVKTFSVDYFNNKKGLALTEDAINRKYAAFDREYLARANTADNILAGRKDFIEKTHANPDSSHLQYINRANAW